MTAVACLPRYGIWHIRLCEKNHNVGTSVWQSGRLTALVYVALRLLVVSHRRFDTSDVGVAMRPSWPMGDESS